MGARANNHSLADWLSNIGEPTRLKIIRALATGSKNVTELARLLNVEIVNVSHHLQRLRQADINQVEIDRLIFLQCGFEQIGFGRLPRRRTHRT